MKLVLHALHENELPFINGGDHVTSGRSRPCSASRVIVVTLAITAAASLYKTRVVDAD